jgi:hypothetical protein
MVKLTILDKRYQFPERITLEKWRRLANLDFGQPSQWARILSIIIDEDEALISKCRLDSLTLAISFCIELMNTRRKTTMKDFSAFTLGEFIDLDCYVSISVEKHIEDVIKMLSDEQITMADEALWLLEQYMAFRMSTYRAYSGLFGLNEPKEDEDTDDEEVFDPNKVIKNWYTIIMELAEGNILNIDAVTEQPYKKAFNFMAWKKEKAQAERYKQIQQEQQSRHQMSRR